MKHTSTNVSPDATTPIPSSNTLSTPTELILEMPNLRLPEVALSTDQLPILRDLPVKAREEISSRLKRCDLAAHEVILPAGDACGLIFFIAKGTVKVSARRGGRDVFLNLAGPGEVLGEVSLLDGLGHSATVTALEAVTAYCLPCEILKRHLLRSPEASLSVARIVSRRLRLSTSRIEMLGTLDVLGRVAHQISAFAREYGQQHGKDSVLIPMRLTQQDLAELVGSTREHVNRAITALRKQGAIDLAHDHRIIVCSMQALERRSR